MRILPSNTLQRPLKSPSPSGSIFSLSSPSNTSIEYSKIYNSDDDEDYYRDSAKGMIPTTTTNSEASSTFYVNGATGSAGFINAPLLYASDSIRDDEASRHPMEFFEGGGGDLRGHWFHSENDSDGDGKGALGQLNERMEGRVDRMFHPLQQQRQRLQNRALQRHLHPQSYHDRSLDRNKYIRQQKYRNNKREALKANYRGSMEDFVLRQEEEDMRKRIERDSEINQITDPDRYLDDNDYDADDDDDFDRPHRASKVEEQQLEDLLNEDRIELEEMTRNLSLN
ncbi:DEKNAAC101736 [Brettanomyces naardenensis]|uniref:DEKNAAC101736 n=1 Tax=Brettanomyces naardenensis TaxID=13370 RepID=A0A448YIZ2_BRENA|nr:DEKNAAC101736 [Brettanomyces naardenensis]